MHSNYISTANRIRDPYGLDTGFCFEGSSLGFNENVPNPDQICSCNQPNCTCAAKIEVPSAVYGVKANGDNGNAPIGVAIAVLIFFVIWGILGLAALIMSIVCFGKSPKKTGLNVGGLLMALFLGPFYWIYFFALKGEGYCVSKKR